VHFDCATAVRLRGVERATNRDRLRVVPTGPTHDLPDRFCAALFAHGQTQHHLSLASLTWLVTAARASTTRPSSLKRHAPDRTSMRSMTPAGSALRARTVRGPALPLSQHSGKPPVP
jgi:hypothetical protein